MDVLVPALAKAVISPRLFPSTLAQSLCIHDLRSPFKFLCCLDYHRATNAQSDFVSVLVAKILIHFSSLSCITTKITFALRSSLSSSILLAATPRRLALSTRVKRSLVLQASIYRPRITSSCAVYCTTLIVSHKLIFDQIIKTSPTPATQEAKMSGTELPSWTPEGEPTNTQTASAAPGAEATDVSQEPTYGNYLKALKYFKVTATGTPWTEEEDLKILYLVDKDFTYIKITEYLTGRSKASIARRYGKIRKAVENINDDDWLALRKAVEEIGQRPDMKI